MKNPGCPMCGTHDYQMSEDWYFNADHQIVVLCSCPECGEEWTEAYAYAGPGPKM